MKIEVANPPNFDVIVKAFPNATKPGVLFAYGGVVYNPSGILIPSALLAHEAAHLTRQDSPNAWWDSYISDPEFRYGEELIAHAAEYRVQRGNDRNINAMILFATAQRLIAPLYNYQPGKFTLRAAITDLREMAV